MSGKHAKMCAETESLKKERIWESSEEQCYKNPCQSDFTEGMDLELKTEKDPALSLVGHRADMGSLSCHLILQSHR